MLLLARSGPLSVEAFVSWCGSERIAAGFSRSTVNSNCTHDQGQGFRHPPMGGRPQRDGYLEKKVMVGVSSSFHARSWRVVGCSLSTRDDERSEPEIW
ncbi:unnamed protein product [Ectocarpus sp. 12 AP-2014]